MRNHNGHLRWAGVLAISILFLLPAYGQEQGMKLQSAVFEDADKLSSNLEIAYAQHEIIMLHIKNSQFDKVLPEVQLLLSIKFPAEQELHTVQSIVKITDLLYKEGQTALAHQIFAAAEKSVSNNSNKAWIYIMHARAYKREGQDAKAIECFRKSQELNAQELNAKSPK